MSKGLHKSGDKHKQRPSDKGVSISAEQLDKLRGAIPELNTLPPNEQKKFAQIYYSNSTTTFSTFPLSADQIDAFERNCNGSIERIVTMIEEDGKESRKRVLNNDKEFFKIVKNGQWKSLLALVLCLATIVYLSIIDAISVATALVYCTAGIIAVYIFRQIVRPISKPKKKE